MSSAQPARRTLLTITVAVGVLIAAYVSFWMPALDLPLAVSQIGLEGQSVTSRFGLSLASISLLPALVAAIPLLLPDGARGMAGAACAAALTVFSVVSGNLGLYYLPIALLLGAATIVPWALRRGVGPGAARAWRFAAAALLALPALLVTPMIFTGEPVIWVAVLLWIVAPLVLATLCAFGMSAGYALTALAGVSVMITALVDHGFLFAGFWLAAAVYLTIGASGFAARGSAR